MVKEDKNDFSISLTFKFFRNQLKTIFILYPFLVMKMISTF